MTPRIAIDFKDRATPELQRCMAALTPPKLARIVGPPCRELTRDHIKRLPRNKKGWPSTGFWEDAARGTTWIDNKDGSVTIRVNKIGFRQRYYGGVIRAVNAKFLTIPISAQAYGKTAADFPGSFIITTPKGAYIVQYGGSVGKRGRANKANATLEFLFKLQRSVNQAEMPWIIPGATAYTATAIEAMGNYFREVKAGGA